MNAYETLKQLRREESKLMRGCALSNERYEQWQAKLREIDKVALDLVNEVAVTLSGVSTFENLAVVKPAVDLLKHCVETNVWLATEEQKATAREAQAKIREVRKAFNEKVNAAWKALGGQS